MLEMIKRNTDAGYWRLPGEDKYLSCQTVREEKHEHLNERKKTFQ